MKKLFDSINSEYLNSTTAGTLRGLTANATSLYHGRAPQETAHPFIEVSFATSLTEMTNSSDFREPVITFDVWSDSRSPIAVNNIGDEIINVYRDNLLSVTGFSTIRADVVSESELEQPDAKGWNYQVMIQYQLGS